ncbi:hypothetical protein V1634_00030 [Plantactinospora veratri]|uniref:Uncharacterized protein n=1 Tax=Plantactinospora veratri TaxID=1436122 RepID=A0ABU7S6J2_9ACTN
MGEARGTWLAARTDWVSSTTAVEHDYRELETGLDLDGQAAGL